MMKEGEGKKGGEEKAKGRPDEGEKGLYPVRVQRTVVRKND